MDSCMGGAWLACPDHRAGPAGGKEPRAISQPVLPSGQTPGQGDSLYISFLLYWIMHFFLPREGAIVIISREMALQSRTKTAMK